MSPNGVNGNTDVATKQMGSNDSKTVKPPSSDRTKHLATWAANLQYEDLPRDVIERTKDFFLDWLACTLAGRSHAAITAIVKFVDLMGPSSGGSELLNFDDKKTSVAFAALVNGASSHVVEQDDLHNSSMSHPATTVYPAALAAAQDLGATGKEFITACVVGYDVACRTGEFLGKEHYKHFHTTATAGVVGVAAAVGRLLKLTPEEMIWAIGTAGTQASGLWQFLSDASHSKQVHTGKACFDGAFAAYTAKAGLLGPRNILEGAHGMGATMSKATTPVAIDNSLGTKFSVLESSFKWHASCRHTHPSVDALLALMAENHVQFNDIEKVVCRTYRSAIDILTLSEKGETVHQSKFSMGFVLAVAAKNGQAMISDFTEEALLDTDLRGFQKRVSMVLDPEIEKEFPLRWQGLVEVTTKDGRKFEKFVGEAKGDPGNTLTRQELEKKVLSLAAYGKVKDIGKVRRVIERSWNLENEDNVLGFNCA